MGANAVEQYARDGRKGKAEPHPLESPLRTQQARLAAVSGGVLFEHLHRGNLWRLEVVTWKGRTFANWRKFYDDKGESKPTTQGFTMPLDSLADLTVALMSHHGIEQPDPQAADG